MASNIPMEPSLEKVIAATVSYICHNGGYVTKTKLLKLLYLFDVEYYRTHRNIFTGFDWIYYHLGPWTAPYDSLLNDWISRNILMPRQSSNPDNETVLYHSSEDVELFKLFPDYQDEKTLRIVLSTWGDKTTAEILDYVYFHTEPMIQGVRGEALDFSLIPHEKPSYYKRESSGKKPKELAAMRKRISEGLNKGSDRTTEAHAFTQPKYDEEFIEALEKLETMY